ncbi:MAG: pyruvate, phosphate dikinase [Sebaldella sp.]|nr:pyruvate, phosphate dikinase [Sebaldella sp.]
MKFIYQFNEGNKDMKDILGGKGANLAEMTSLGLNVPPGFTISTKACRKYLEDNSLWMELKESAMSNLKLLELKANKSFFGNRNLQPLLLSVRSGAPNSMPGMMDTILNLGLNDSSVKLLAQFTSNERFAYDSYRRFIEMFSNVVADIPRIEFERLLDKVKTDKNYKTDSELTVSDLKLLIDKYKKIYFNFQKSDFPEDSIRQLFLAVEAVFRSWDNPRAVTYRNLHNISHDIGTAVNIQAMVFGNMGETSGTGVLFTRNPINGNDELFGEYLINAQGEDVVAGTRTPAEISELKRGFPNIYEELSNISKKLEEYFKDIQDIEFTIENGKLYFLQVRSAKRAPLAAINTVCNLVEEKVIDKAEAIKRINSKDLENLLHPVFDETYLKKSKVIGKGLAASPGAASGKVYFDPADVTIAKGKGEKVVLVREETSPEDIEGMIYSEGILTSKGGMTSHAAVVARGIGKCCITGCESIIFNKADKSITINNNVIKEGDYISIDGSTGNIYLGEIPKVKLDTNENFKLFLQWLDEYKEIGVRANADTPIDVAHANQFNTDGIGLCRTEHMFFNKVRIPIVRSMILANSEEERIQYLNELLEFQRDDFKAIFELMNNKPVNIRLLDPPLHEFLPKTEKEINSLAASMGITEGDIHYRIENLKESNPMLGHRGCRLAVTFPEIYKMQVRAIIEAAISVKEKGINISPEIMVPLVCDKQELDFVKKHLIEEINLVFEEKNEIVKYHIGTMIEIPRAALLADEIAESADFFSFGTNDLTQMTFGFSRDDSNKFLFDYMNNDIFNSNPFSTLDKKGVGKLIEMTALLGRTTNKNIKLGICGEQAGDPEALDLYMKLGINYLSCSPFRIPLVKLALAKRAINNESLTI